VQADRGDVREPRRIVSVTPWLPSTDARYAGHKFYFEYLQVLAKRFDVVVVAPDCEENQALANGEHGWETVLVPPVRRRTGIVAELDALRLQGRGEPIPDIVPFLRQLGGLPDVVELNWSTLMTLAPPVRRLLPNTYISVIQYDRYSTTLRWGKLTRLRWRRRARDSAAGVIISVQERVLAKSFDLVAAFKASDVQFVHRSGTTTVVLDPWIEDPGARAPSTSGQDVLFVGAFNRAENVEGAMWLIANVWPAVKKEHPKARLVLAGANPTEQLKQRTDGSMVVTGFVEDLGPYYSAAYCSVAPIFSGGGLRFKVVQAMCCGVPLVATPAALEGMEGIPMEYLAGATSDAKEFARGICEVLANMEAAQRRADALKAWADHRFSFPAKLEDLVSHYERAVAAKTVDGRGGR
jgi:glycosyltransferase involved in cell wall biosynthesis